MKKIAIGISAAALAIAGTAFAAHHEGRSNPDSNGDGVVTRSESQAHATAKFAKMDANGDGQLDQTDRAAKRQDRRAKMFAKLDANTDGSISRDEFMTFERPHKGKHGMSEGGKKHRKGRRGGGRHGMKMMKMADTNNDGVVSQAEFAAAAGKRFDTIDANNDGQITKEERQAHRQERRGKWRNRTGG
ncbi:MAG: EF-hand domain-containing protein [Novosphingobium sp.]|nr:EF-hand domain-containing protein [Novosphingobium sp.]